MFLHTKVDDPRILVLPGVTSEGGGVTRVPGNAVGAAAKLTGGRDFEFKPYKGGLAARFTPLAFDRRVLEGNGLHPWVWDFMLPFQKEGIAFAAQRAGSMLHWSTGGGKSLGAIVWALLSKQTTIFITASKAVFQLNSEIQRFSSARTFICRSLTPTPIPSGVKFVIVSWPVLRGWYGTLCRLNPESVIFDEVHSAKNPKRYKTTVNDDGTYRRSTADNMSQHAKALALATTRRIALTATLIADRARDAWAPLDLIEPGAWGRWTADLTQTSFAKRYCGATLGEFGGIITTGDSNMPELRERMARTLHIVDASVSHAQLPPVRRAIFHVEVEDQVKPVGLAVELRKAQNAGGAGYFHLQLLEAAARKRKVVVEQAVEALRANQKVVISTGRVKEAQAIYDAIAKELDSARGLETSVPLWCVTGENTTAETREAIRLEYMARADAACIIATYQSVGESISLHDTDLAICAMLPVTPKELRQWEGRFSRLGQRRPCLMVYVLARNTVDEKVAAWVLKKLPAVGALVGDSVLASIEKDLRGDEDAIRAKLMAMFADGSLGGEE